MQKHKVVSEAEWIEASSALLSQEKAWTRERDRLAEKRRALPWVRVTKDYMFEGENGQVRLADLFDAAASWSCIISCSGRNGRKAAPAAHSSPIMWMAPGSISSIMM